MMDMTRAITMNSDKLSQGLDLLRQWVDEEVKRRPVDSVHADLMRVTSGLLQGMRENHEVSGCSYYQLHDRLLSLGPGQLMPSMVYAKLVKGLTREQWLELKKDEI